MDELLNLDNLPELFTDEAQADTAEAEVETAEESAEEAAEATETDGQATAEADANSEPAAEPAAAEPDADASADSEEAEDVPQPVVRVKFNKQEREFSLDEAKPLVEMGLKYEAFKPEYEKLKDLASGYGFTVTELIENLSKQADDALYQKILDECEGNEKWAKREFEAQKAERDRKIREAREAEQARHQQEEQETQEQLHKRLASDFVELSREEPDKFKSIQDVPQKVLDDAIKSGRSLFDAYLRYERAEARKAAAAQAKQAEASKKTTGSMQSQTDAQDSIYDDVTRAIFGT